MKLRLTLLLSFYFLLNTFYLIAQIVEESGTIEVFVENLLDEMPLEDSNEYQPPTNEQINAWNVFFEDVVKGNFSEAANNASSIGYEVVKFFDTDNSIDYYIVRKSSASSNWWGTYLFNPQAKRSDLVFEAPHALKDFNTGRESALAFKQMNAWSLSITGTHRCNNLELSACDGTTQVCSGGSTAFRISDMAHSTDGIFYESAVIVDNQKQNLAKHIQLHGFGRNEGDPAFIISNGVTDLTSGNDVLQILADNLLLVDDSYTSEIAHKNPEIKLKGTTNTIGRWINGSPEPCMESANNNSGRFFHIEQAFDGIRDSEANWQKVITALEMTFPEDVVSSIDDNAQNVTVMVSPNPVNDAFQVSYIFNKPANFTRSIVDLSGKIISHKTMKLTEPKFNETITSPDSPGIYILRTEFENKIKITKFIQK